MPLHPKDSALAEALRLDYSAAPLPRAEDDLGAMVLAALAAEPQPLTACVVVFDSATLPSGTYCLDFAGYLIRVHPQPPPLPHLDAEVAVLLGGPATASPADFRRFTVAAGVVSHHLTHRLGSILQQVAGDDETIAWPLPTANASIAHLTTVTGKDMR